MKKWSEVAASKEYKALGADEQNAARMQYFDEVVAPQVPDADRDSAWKEFDADTGSKKRASVKDAAVNAGVAVNEALGGFASVFGADNRAARFFSDNADTMRSNLSPEAVGQEARNARELENTEGFVDKFVVGGRQALEQPGQTAAKALGYLAPTIVTGGAGAVAGLGRMGLTALNAVTGAAQGAGAVKGGIYDTVMRAKDTELLTDPAYAELRKTLPESDAKALLAAKLQSYQENGGKIATGAAVGAATGMVGAEAGIASAMTKQQTRAALAKEAALLQVPKKAAAEVLTEVPQEGLENVLGNLGAASGGATIDPLQGVPESMGQAAVAGPMAGGMGGAMGVQSARSQLRRVGSEPSVDANTVLDTEATAAGPLALPAPTVTVDSRGNARRDGNVPPVGPLADEQQAKAVGRAEIREAMQKELAALGYDPTPRAMPTPIAVDADGNATTDAQLPTRDATVEPAARVVGRADIRETMRAELAALGYEPSPARAQQTPIAVDRDGNATTDAQSLAARRDATLGDLPRTVGTTDTSAIRAQLRQELQSMGYTPNQGADTNVAQNDEARLRELADKANAKREARKVQQAATFTKRGDFWNYAGDRVREIADALDLTVTKGRDGRAMVGIPEHARKQYASTLREAGINATFDGAPIQQPSSSMGDIVTLRGDESNKPTAFAVRTKDAIKKKATTGAIDAPKAMSVAETAAEDARNGPYPDSAAVRTGEGRWVPAVKIGETGGRAIAGAPTFSDAGAAAGWARYEQVKANEGADVEALQRLQDNIPGWVAESEPPSVAATTAQKDESALESADETATPSSKDTGEPPIRRTSRMAEEMAALNRKKAGAQENSADQDAIDAFNRDLSRDAGRPVKVHHVVQRVGSPQDDLARATREKLGARVVFFRSDDPVAPGGAASESAPGVLFVHADEGAPTTIVGHEFLHELRRAHPDLYDALHATLSDHTVTLQAQKGKIRNSYGRDIGEDRTAEENVADVAGAAFTDPAFWERFEDELNGDTGKLKQFFRWAARWLARTFGGKIDLDSDGGLKRAADRMLDDVAKAYAEAAQRNPTVRSMAADMELSVRRAGRSSWVDPAVKFTSRTLMAQEMEELQNKGKKSPEDEGSTAARVGVAAIKSIAPITATAQAANKAVNRIGEEMARLTGVKKLGEKAVAAVERAVDTKSSWGWLEKTKQGLVADYGLPEEYLDAKLGKQVRENKLMREAKGTLDRLSAMTPDQLAVAYQWLQEKPDTARERDLLDKLPAEQQDVMRQMKGDIDKLSREALGLGLISQETYDRNKMAYVHRSYAKYEAELTGSQAVARQRAQRLKGDQFKGRGMELEASLERVRGDLPEDLKGLKLEMLEKRNDDGRLTRREYLVQGQKRPNALADYTSAGIWEVRDATKGGKLKVWRDFTLAERQRMGEIEDARYGFARTMLAGIRDVETSRFLQWADKTYAKDSDDGLDVAEINPMHAMLGSQTFTRDQWVHVPETKIKSTQVHRYGALAGKYVPAVMYSDLTGVMESRTGLWDQMLGAWKTSKTALSPAVHINNVMSNFIMADIAEVGVNDIRKALETIVASKAGDAKAKALIERYDDSGAESGSFAAHEIKTTVLEPLLKQIAEGEPELVQKASLMNVVSLAVHGQLKEAAVASGKTLPGRALLGTMEAMIHAYQSEDAVFRLAKFMNEVNAGKTDLEAGKAARDAFLNYDINAPWVRAARRSALPFISFTYRAVPLLARAVTEKPWKFAKYAALGEALSTAAYMILGGEGDEEKEKRALPDDLNDKALGIFPKMVRMPWNDKEGDPMWLDVRRWLPAGDLTDTGNSKASVPLPSWLSIGGPLSLLIDFYSNTNWRGDKVIKGSDTPGEIAMKVTDMVAKFMLPNLPVPGAGWLLRQVGAPVDTGMLDPYGWTGIERGLNGAKDGFGKEADLGIASARSMGLKLEARRVESDLARAGMDFKTKEREIKTEARAIARKAASGQIDQAEGKRRIAREIEKLKDLELKARKRMGNEINAL